MSNISSLKRIKYNDLREEALLSRLPVIVGRTDEQNRLSRIIGRTVNNNAIIVGPSGIGKTAFFYGWVRNLVEKGNHQNVEFLQFENDHLYNFDSNSEEGEYFKNITSKVSECVVFIDNFGKNIYNNSALLQNTMNLYDEVIKNPQSRLVLVLEPYEYNWIKNQFPSFFKSFEVIELKKQKKIEYLKIIESKLAKLNKKHRIMIPSDTIEDVISYIERFPVLGQLPQSAINIIDEGIVYAHSLDKKSLRKDLISEIVSMKVNVPVTQLNQSGTNALGLLEKKLSDGIVGQNQSISKIVKTLQRAKLGIRNPNKPLGSFLILGPSGVGKTETAKIISEALFGRNESFIRFDMSEFGQEHTSQRLIGAPAGYSGYESGGALTNALLKEPHSLILLDEIEKAHSKIFDIFLQVLDDGRITSGQNETVDACNSVIIATSNIGVDKILQESKKGGDVSKEDFISNVIVPELLKHFRSEFINRFDSILIFNPLSSSDLLKIAQLEVKKVENRLSKHKVKFDIDVSDLSKMVNKVSDPRFGARPVKRLIEETCESLLVNVLMKK